MARKNVTAWRRKQTFDIIAPEEFEYKKLGSCLANDPEAVEGRSVDVSLWDMLNDKSKQHMKIIFRITELKGGRAHTEFKKFEVNPGYLRSKVKKGSSKVDSIITLELNDDVTVKVKVTAITYNRVSKPTKKDIRQIMRKTIRPYKKMGVNEFVQQVIAGKVGSNVYKKLRDMTPMRRVEIEEVKVV